MRRFVEALGAVLVAALVAGAVPAQAQTATPLPERVLGKPDAPVTILDYSSMTCPHCADFHARTLPKLKEQYIDTGKAKLVFREFPLDRVALQASILTRCAPESKFFPLLDVLFKSQGQWARAEDPQKALAQIGKLAGMTQDSIDACFADKALADGILAMRLEGQQKYNVNSTPTFVLNDGAERIEGAQPVETFGKAIDGLAK